MRTPSTPRPRWSWSLGRLFGIAIRVHVTLLLLLAWIGIGSALAGSSLAGTVIDLTTIVLVFGIVVIHELAHALVARRFGCPTSEILLLPIGGMARLERMPERARDELLVALAGPLLNIVLAGGLAIAIVASGASFDPLRVTGAGDVLVVRLFWINASLAGFNLLPAFPMDGGRVLRAALTTYVGPMRATRIASMLGKALAVVFVLGGLLISPMLALIGVFVWFAAEHEVASLEARAAFSHAAVRDVMIRAVDVIDAGATVSEAAERLLADGQRQLAVASHGVVDGVVRDTDVERGLARRAPDVAAIARRPVPVVAPDVPLAAALPALAANDVAFVVENDDIVGLLTSEQVAAYAALHPGTPQPVRR